MGDLESDGSVKSVKDSPWSRRILLKNYDWVNTRCWKLFNTGCWILLACLLLSPTTTFAHQAPNQQVVHMTKEGFDPKTVEIGQGQTVVFENADDVDRWPASNIHPTHQIYPELDPKKPVKPGDSWSFGFDKVGTWKFHDHLYPQLTGTVTVKSESDSPAPEFQKIEKPPFVMLSAMKDLWNKLSNYYHNISLSIKKIFFNDIADVQLKSNIEPVDVGKLEKNFDQKCSFSDYTCISKSLKLITQKFGPQNAVNLLEKLKAGNQVLATVDEHQLAHEIGRETAKSFGISAKSFLLCPMSSFNGGCQHGYFEAALGKSGDAKAAADLICGSLDNSYSQKFKFYCYHGVGHGVMMAQAYDLKASLSICNSLDGGTAEDLHSQTSGTVKKPKALSGVEGEGCWQGVFMENVNGGIKSQAREGIFSQDDPLAPCNGVEEKYRHECFINHSGWLMKFAQNDINKAATYCLKAPTNQVSTCLQSLGLLATNPAWQPSIIGKSDPADGVEVALQICDQFPKSGRKDCFIGALDNIANNDEIVNLDRRALKFCQKANWNKKDCYGQIGINIARQVVDIFQRRNLCSKVENDFQKNCLYSAGIF